MSNFLKTPLVNTLSAGAVTQVRNAVQLLGKALPCHVTAVAGAMITVAFDVTTQYTLPEVTIPLFGPEYIRYPIKAGDLGYVIPVDCPVGFTSGQAASPADIISAPSNLEALYFQPIGSVDWVVVDPTQVTAYAPNGVLLRDTASDTSINLKPGTITMTVGATSMVLTSSAVTVNTQTFTINAPTIVLDGQMTQGTSGGGYPATLQGPLTVIHEVTANGIPLSTHLHGGVQTGSGNTGVPHT